MGDFSRQGTNLMTDRNVKKEKINFKETLSLLSAFIFRTTKDIGEHGRETEKK